MTHMRGRGTFAAAVALAAGSAVALGCGDNGSPTSPAGSRYVVSAGLDGNFPTIAAAIKAAPTGEVIEVRGAIGERVVIDKPGVRLRGGASGALDGALLDGRGVGILVTAPDVEISNLTVRNFERGIVVQNTSNVVIQGNEVHANNNRAATTSPPLAPGVDLYEGIVLIGASNTQIIENVVRDNGHDGLMIMGGSNNNVVRNNRMLNNGTQTQPGRFG
ncbi:MAG TPA: right-handed parallel beta-helix repeat-containing protein [Vicinamibacterales bacterium]|nr:right-handed parallel beta-helix repeat-containing protein [Vicinamibacterales bacterium]